MQRIPNPIFECIVVIQLYFNYIFGILFGKCTLWTVNAPTEAVKVPRGLSEKYFLVTSLTVQRAPTSLQTETDVFVNYKIKYMFVVEIPKYFSWQTESI